eukprot:CFRG2863T1
MGRNKKDDRQKKGTTSSSSQAAAELVSKQSPNQFIGFQTLQNNPVFLASGGQGTSNHGNANDLLSNSEFRIAFKMLLKRDSVTKVKALQSLSELIQTSEEDAMVQSLVYWPQLYTRLAVDVDRRTRVEANICMREYAVRAKKQIAPYLKKLLPHWLCCQHDVYADVSSIAIAAFDAVFAQNKQAGVFEFCSSEISALIVENLITQKCDSVEDATNISADEQKKTRQSLVVSSSLGALTTFVKRVPHSVSQPVLEEVLASKKFWAHYGSGNTEIRSRFYSLIVGTVDADVEGMNARIDVVAPVVLSMFGEKHSGLHSLMWETVLIALKALPDIWSTVKKGAIGHLKVWGMLSSAGYGSPAVAIPCCVPLLSLIPSHLRFDPYFAGKFLASMWEGLSACTKESQRNCVINGYVEVFTYLTLEVLKYEDSVSQPFIQQVWFNQLLLNVSLTISIPASSHTFDTRILYNGIWSLLGMVDFGNDMQSRFLSTLLESISETTDGEHRVPPTACAELSIVLACFLQLSSPVTDSKASWPQVVTFMADVVAFCLLPVAKENSLPHITLLANAISSIHSSYSFYALFYAHLSKSTDIRSHSDLVEMMFEQLDKIEKGNQNDSGIGLILAAICVPTPTNDSISDCTNIVVDSALWTRLLALDADVTARDNLRLGVARELSCSLNGERGYQSNPAMWRLPKLDDFIRRTVQQIDNANEEVSDGSLELVKVCIAAHSRFHSSRDANVNSDSITCVARADTVDFVLTVCLRALQIVHERLDLEESIKIEEYETPSLKMHLDLCYLFFGSFLQHSTRHMNTCTKTDASVCTCTMRPCFIPGKDGDKDNAARLVCEKACFSTISDSALPLLSVVLGIATLLLPPGGTHNNEESDVVGSCLSIFKEGVAALRPPTNYACTSTPVSTFTSVNQPAFPTIESLHEHARQHLTYLCVRRIVRTAEEAPLASTTISRMDNLVFELMLVLNSVCIGHEERQYCIQLAIARADGKSTSTSTPANSPYPNTQPHVLAPNHMRQALLRLPYVMSARNVLTGVVLIGEHQWCANIDMNLNLNGNVHSADEIHPGISGVKPGCEGVSVLNDKSIHGSEYVNGEQIVPSSEDVVQLARLAVFWSSLFMHIGATELYFAWEDDDEGHNTKHENFVDGEEQVGRAKPCSTPSSPSVSANMDISSKSKTHKYMHESAKSRAQVCMEGCDKGDYIQMRIRSLLTLVGARIYVQCALKAHARLHLSLQSHPNTDKGYVERLLKDDYIPALLCELLIDLENACKQKHAIGSVAMLSRVLAAAGVLKSKQPIEMEPLPMKSDVITAILECAVKHDVINAATVEVLVSTLSSAVDIAPSANALCHETMNTFMLLVNSLAPKFPRSPAMSSLRDACLLSVLDSAPDALYTYAGRITPTDGKGYTTGTSRTLSALGIINCTLHTEYNLTNTPLVSPKSTSAPVSPRGRNRPRSANYGQHRQCMSEKQVIDRLIKHIVPFYNSNAQAARLRDRSYLRTREGALSLNGAIQIGRLVYRMTQMDRQENLVPTRLLFVLRCCTEWLEIGNDYNSIPHRALVRMAFSILATTSAILSKQMSPKKKSFDSSRQSSKVDLNSSTSTLSPVNTPTFAHKNLPLLVEVDPLSTTSKNENQSCSEDEYEELDEDMDEILRRKNLCGQWENVMPRLLSYSLSALLEGDIHSLMTPSWPRRIVNESVCDFITTMPSATDTTGASTTSASMPSLYTLLLDSNEITLPKGLHSYEEVMERCILLMGTHHLPTQLSLYILLERQVVRDLDLLHREQLKMLLETSNSDEPDLTDQIVMLPRQALMAFLAAHTPATQVTSSRSQTPNNSTQSLSQAGMTNSISEQMASIRITEPELLDSPSPSTPLHNIIQSSTYTHRENGGITAYLLGWLLLLKYIRNATSAVRVDYAEHLRSLASVEQLLDTLTDWLPYSTTRTSNTVDTHIRELKDYDVRSLWNCVRHENDSLNGHNTTTNNSNDRSNDIRRSMHTHVCTHELAPFPTIPPQDTAYGNVNTTGGDENVNERIRMLAAFVYYEALSLLPALCRLWYNDVSRSVREKLEKYTTDCVSPLLIGREISNTARASNSDENLTLKASTVTKEVTAVYHLDEIALEVVIRLAPNYPLGMVSVNSPSDMGIKSYRRWMLQMTTFLSSQNGSILEAVEMWKRNIDKRYDGVEECTVCYSVLHSSNYQLPKLRCRTCRKKFHSKCLYRWFQSSSQSTCPMCRSQFQ